MPNEYVTRCIYIYVYIIRKSIKRVLYLTENDPLCAGRRLVRPRPGTSCHLCAQDLLRLVRGSCAKSCARSCAAAQCGGGWTPPRSRRKIMLTESPQKVLCEVLCGSCAVLCGPFADPLFFWGARPGLQKLGSNVVCTRKSCAGPCAPKTGGLVRPRPVAQDAAQDFYSRKVLCASCARAGFTARSLVQVLCGFFC